MKPLMPIPRLPPPTFTPLNKRDVSDISDEELETAFLFMLAYLRRKSGNKDKK